jgi:hypothetical protein
LSSTSSRRSRTSSDTSNRCNHWIPFGQVPPEILIILSTLTTIGFTEPCISLRVISRISRTPCFSLESSVPSINGLAGLRRCEGAHRSYSDDHIRMAPHYSVQHSVPVRSILTTHPREPLSNAAIDPCLAGGELHHPVNDLTWSKPTWH